MRKSASILRRLQICSGKLGLAVLAALLLAPGFARAEGIDEMLRLYQDSQFLKAKEIAAGKKDEPVAKLVYSLCQIHDPDDQDVAAGLSGLKSMIDDEALLKSNKRIWAEAATSYARLIQVYQTRKMNVDLTEGVDVEAIYKKIIKQFPSTIEGCTALIYLGDNYLFSEDSAKVNKGFALIEDFIASYKGDKKDLVPVHLYVESFYIRLKEDYEKSFAHIKAAYDAGITKQTLSRATLFRLARICDLKLGKRKEAKAYYEKYLKLYPFAKRTPIAKRYLQELMDKGI